MNARAKPIPGGLDACGPAVRRLDCWYEVAGIPGVESPMFRLRKDAERWLAEQLAKMPTHLRPRERKCMCCAQEFHSDGPHIRLCKGCRRSDAGPVAMGWARPQRRGDGAAR